MKSDDQTAPSPPSQSGKSRYAISPLLPRVPSGATVSMNSARCANSSTDCCTTLPPPRRSTGTPPIWRMKPPIGQRNSDSFAMKNGRIFEVGGQPEEIDEVPVARVRRRDQDEAARFGNLAHRFPSAQPVQQQQQTAHRARHQPRRVVMHRRHAWSSPFAPDCAKARRGASGHRGVAAARSFCSLLAQTNGEYR